MPEDKPIRNCFIIMPIDTPTNLIDGYLNDANHFKHVRECLFNHSIEKAEFKPIPPISSGSSIIQADILKNLSEAELVLCDMSILNPNVFFEFGIRTALNKPVALIKDDKIQNFPFDTSPIQCHTYDSSLSAWSLQNEIDKLSIHIKDTFNKSSDHNPMWKIFGGGQAASLKPEEITIKEQFDFLLGKILNIENQLNQVTSKMPAVGYSGYSSAADVFPCKPLTITELYAKWFGDETFKKNAINSLYREIAKSQLQQKEETKEDPTKKDQS